MIYSGHSYPGKEIRLGERRTKKRGGEELSETLSRVATGYGLPGLFTRDVCREGNFKPVSRSAETSQFGNTGHPKQV